MFVKGYEGGFEDANIREEIIDVVLNVHEAWYYGPHEYINNITESEIKNYTTVKGIIIWAK